jgi:hypothetical protein
LRALQVGAKLNTLLIVDNNPSQQDDVKGVVFLEQKQNNRIGEARWRVPGSPVHQLSWRLSVPADRDRRRHRLCGQGRL